MWNCYCIAVYSIQYPPILYWRGVSKQYIFGWLLIFFFSMCLIKFVPNFHPGKLSVNLDTCGYRRFEGCCFGEPLFVWKMKILVTTRIYQLQHGKKVQYSECMICLTSVQEMLIWPLAAHFETYCLREVVSSDWWALWFACAAAVNEGSLGNEI